MFSICRDPYRRFPHDQREDERPNETADQGADNHRDYFRH